MKRILNFIKQATGMSAPEPSALLQPLADQAKAVKPSEAGALDKYIKIAQQVKPHLPMIEAAVTKTGNKKAATALSALKTVLNAIPDGAPKAASAQSALLKQTSKLPSSIGTLISALK